jgi:ribosomal protein S17
MPKKRRFARQSATNPRQIKASGPKRMVSVVLDNGDGTARVAMVSEEELEALQRKQTRTVRVEAEDSSETTLTVGDTEEATA